MKINTLNSSKIILSHKIWKPVSFQKFTIVSIKINRLKALKINDMHSGGDEICPKSVEFGQSQLFAVCLEHGAHAEYVRANSVQISAGLIGRILLTVSILAYGQPS